MDFICLGRGTGWINISAPARISGPVPVTVVVKGEGLRIFVDKLNTRESLRLQVGWEGEKPSGLFELFVAASASVEALPDAGIFPVQAIKNGKGKRVG